MSFKKLLALLLALAMLVCCFAACGSSDDEDEDEDEKVEDKADDEEEEDEDEDDKSKDDDEDADEDDEDAAKDDEDEDKDAAKDDEDEDELVDEAALEGTWYLELDLKDIIYSNSGIDVDGSLELCLVYEFDGEGEYHYSTANDPSDSDVEDFAEAYFEAAMEFQVEVNGCDDMDELEELCIQYGYESLAAFEEEIRSLVEQDIDSIKNAVITEYDDDYEYDSDDGLLVIEDTDYYVDMNSKGTEMEIVECEDNPSFEGLVFEKQ